ncbi:zinc transporter binding subunit ZevA [Rodentibacter caecimuris]|uniref:ABC transporter n=1 Tax=Rodentibacter caecimuris TaxID=1796644 RepID=A0ABX3L0T4_9PAST|nr:ABC transporter [Rodentibacter heylii]
MKKILIVLILFLRASYALAHPHAFIDMYTVPKVENQQLIGFSMRWRLDEASSSAVLYDLALAKGNNEEEQKLVDDIMQNIVNEHYFSYFFDKNNNKIKYKRQPENYGMKEIGSQVEYYFDLLLAKPQPLRKTKLTLKTYDSSYYVAMVYPESTMQAIDFSSLPAHCQGKIIDPNVDDKIRRYASSLDKNQRNEDDSLGRIFAQELQIKCE